MGQLARSPPLGALAVKRLGVPPFWHSPRDFTTLLGTTYAAIGTHALGLAVGRDAE